MTERVLTLIRGLPGSGKSFIGTLLRIEVHENRLRTEQCEADHYYWDDHGNWVFDPKLLPKAHAACQACAKRAMKGRVDNVIVSNTFTQRWEMEPYLRMAREYGYTVQVIECQGDLGSEHNVPLETIEKMRKRWEPFDLARWQVEAPAGLEPASQDQSRT